MKSKTLVFISYAREDYAKARKLYNSLKAYPFLDPWLDKEKLLPGEDWELKITEVIHQSHFFILVLSKNSLTKQGYVQKEVKKALDRLDYFPPGGIYIIPVRIDDCQPSQEQLKRLHWVDLFRNWNYGLERVVEVIQRSQIKVSQKSRKPTPKKTVEIVDQPLQIEPKKERTIRTQALKPKQVVRRKTSKALAIRKQLSKDLHDNISNYATYLWYRELLPNKLITSEDYDNARKSIPNWTNQAKKQWLKELLYLGVLEYDSKQQLQFTNLGINLLDILVDPDKYGYFG